MFEIPEERLPPGFADTVSEPPDRPATARPAATVVVLRDRPGTRPGAGPLEVLLLRRHRRSGFVPGAWVFPGGRVDAADSAPALYERIVGLDSDPTPESAFWTAALRELFEETGVLMARSGDAWSADAASDRRLESLRAGLMDGTRNMMDVLESLDATLDTRRVVHFAHWVTPVVEPRRYDTHFFAAALPDGRSIRTDDREMTEAAWLEPGAALRRFEAGDLPMVFPTIRTLETLAPFESTDHALTALRGLDVPRVLPRLVRTDAGVAIVVDDEPTS
jgi:8-oxo-dGTP pyrophosphatase MutT (NUDIX family)